MTDRHIPSSRMKKYVLMLGREDLTREEFSAYWSGPHARMLAGLPEFWVYAERYLQNHVEQDSAFPNPANWAGLVENWQTDEIHKGKSFANEAVYGQFVTPDELNFLQPGKSIALVTETHVVHDGAAGTIKLLEPVASVDLNQWRNDRLRALKETGYSAAAFIENRVKQGSAVTLAGTPVPQTYDAIGEYRFDDPVTAEAFAKTVRADEMLRISEIEIPRP